MSKNIIKNIFSILISPLFIILITIFFVYPASAATLPTAQNVSGTYDVSSVQMSFNPNPEDLNLQMVEYKYDNSEGWMVRSDLVEGWNNWTKINDPNNQVFYDKITKSKWTNSDLYQMTAANLTGKDKQSGLEQLYFSMHNGSPDSAFNLANGGQIFYSDIKKDSSQYKITDSKMEVGSGGVINQDSSSATTSDGTTGSGSSSSGGGTTGKGDPTKALGDDDGASIFGVINIPGSLPKLFSNLKTAYSKILALIISVSASVFIVMLLVGGYQYLTSAGNEEASSKAKKLLTNAIIGIIVVAISWAAGTWILDFLQLA